MSDDVGRERRRRDGATFMDAAVLDVLQGYAEFRLSSLDAMSALGLHCIEDLYSLTLTAGLDLPRQSRAEAERAADVFLKWLKCGDSADGVRRPD